MLSWEAALKVAAPELRGIWASGVAPSSKWMEPVGVARTPETAAESVMRWPG
jgi:hypothetical protein